MIQPERFLTKETYAGESMKKIIVALAIVLSCQVHAAERSVITLQQEGTQALKAKNFEQVAEIVRQLRAQGAARQANELERKLTLIKGGPLGADIFREVDRLRAEVTDLQNQIDTFVRRGGISQDELQKLVQRHHQALEKLREESAKAERRIAELMQAADMDQKTIQELRTNVSRVNENNMLLNEQLMRCQLKEAKLERDIDELRKQIESKDAEGVIAQLASQNKKLVNENDELTKQNSEMEVLLSTRTLEIKDLQQQLATAENLKAQCDKNAEQCNATLQSQTALLEAKQTELNQLKSSSEGLRQENIRLNQELDQLRAPGGISSECIVLKQENIALRRSLDEYKKTDIPGLKSELKRCGDVVLQLTTEKDRTKKLVDDQAQLIAELQDKLKLAGDGESTKLFEQQAKLLNALQDELKSANETIKNLENQINTLKKQ